MRLIRSQYEAILRRAKKYDAPRDEDHDWNRTTKDQRAVMNLALDLRDCRRALELALPILHRKIQDEPNWTSDVEAAIKAIAEVLA